MTVTLFRFDWPLKGQNKFFCIPFSFVLSDKARARVGRKLLPRPRNIDSSPRPAMRHVLMTSSIRNGGWKGKSKSSSFHYSNGGVVSVEETCDKRQYRSPWANDKGWNKEVMFYIELEFPAKEVLLPRREENYRREKFVRWISAQNTREPWNPSQRTPWIQYSHIQTL